jgi:hypothetical protein
MTEGYAHVDPGGNRQINAVLHRPPGDIAAQLLPAPPRCKLARGPRSQGWPDRAELSEPRSGIP